MTDSSVNTGLKRLQAALHVAPYPIGRMPENGDRAWQEQNRLRMEALEKAQNELQDAFIVMTHTETRMSQLVKQQAEYMANHEARLQHHEQMMRRIDTGLAEATDKINLLIDREMHREGRPEAH